MNKTKSPIRCRRLRLVPEHPRVSAAVRSRWIEQGIGISWMRTVIYMGALFFVRCMCHPKPFRGNIGFVAVDGTASWPKRFVRWFIGRLFNSTVSNSIWFREEKNIVYNRLMHYWLIRNWNGWLLSSDKLMHALDATDTSGLPMNDTYKACAIRYAILHSKITYKYKKTETWKWREGFVVAT